MGDPHIVLSDDDDLRISPIRFYSQQPLKKPRTKPEPEPTHNTNPNPKPDVVLIDDDDPIPWKTAPTDSTVDRFIFLESDNEFEGGLNPETGKDNDEAVDYGFDATEDLCRTTQSEPSSSFSGQNDHVHMSQDYYFGLDSLQDDIPPDERGKKKNAVQPTRRKKMTEEEKNRLKEEKTLKLLQEKQRKQTLRAEAAELKKAEREKKKWENGKNALKSIVAEIDSKVIEMGSVGGNLVTRFSEKGINFRVTSNPIERSILWTMKFPDHINELSGKGREIHYVLLIYDAEEFCKMVVNDSLLNHVFEVQSHYPSHVVCYLTNRLMSYVDKREQERYKNQSNDNSWRRPPIEKVLAKLTTQFNKVHSRMCVDEAELAEHVVGLTFSLATCHFRKKLTRLSVNANGSAIPKDCTDKNLIKENLWLKVLVAIPKVQPRFAVAIWKKYPTMKSLLRVYMDTTKSVHEKEFLLKDLKIEGLLSEDRRLGEVCSKRVYRILMAKSGSIKTDEVENGADFF